MPASTTSITTNYRKKSPTDMQANIHKEISGLGELCIARPFDNSNMTHSIA